MHATSRYPVHRVPVICSIGLAVAAAIIGCDPQTRHGPRSEPPPALEDQRQQVSPGPDIGVTPSPQPRR